jgi:hypothetical protein
MLSYSGCGEKTVTINKPTILWAYGFRVIDQSHLHGLKAVAVKTG